MGRPCAYYQVNTLLSPSATMESEFKGNLQLQGAKRAIKLQTEVTHVLRDLRNTFVQTYLHTEGILTQQLRCLCFMETKNRQIRDHRECCFSVSSKLSNKSNFCSSCKAQMPGRISGQVPGPSGVVAPWGCPGLSQCPAALGIHHGHSGHRAAHGQQAVTLKFFPCPSNVRDITRIRFPLNYTIAKGYNCIKHIMLLP